MAASPRAEHAARGPTLEVLTEPAPPVALYVHVPFCVSVCPYCDFVVYGGAAARGPRNRVAELVEALMTELDLRATALDERFGPPGGDRPALASIYLGGGTPSLLPTEAIARVLARVRERFGTVPAAEITLEVNPGPDERGDLEALARAGVTRVSIGAQRLERAELRALGRRHDEGDVAATVRQAREAGIGSVSLDLLYDVPGDSIDRWRSTLEAAISLEPDHLSLYALTLDDPAAEGLTGPAGDHLPASPGARRWRNRARTGQDEERAADQYSVAVDRLARAGYRGYEISNWARPGHESRHNLAYWHRRPHEAVGPGAHAFDGQSRRWNAARLDAYISALAPVGGGPSLPPGGQETLDPGAARTEAIILALRTDRGVSREEADQPPLVSAYHWARDSGLLEATRDERLVLTTRGRLLSNELFSRLV